MRVLELREKKGYSHVGVCCFEGRDIKQNTEILETNKYMLHYLGLGNGNRNILVCLRFTIKLNWKELGVEHENYKYSKHRTLIL